MKMQIKKVRSNFGTEYVVYTNKLDGNVILCDINGRVFSSYPMTREMFQAFIKKGTITEVKVKKGGSHR